MKQKTIILITLMTLAIGISAQEEKQLQSFHYVEAQAGAQTTAAKGDMSKLTSPVMALSYGYMTPGAGARLHISGFKSQSTVDYDYKYITASADLLLNVSNMFSRNAVHPLNIYLLGGIGLSNTFDRATPEASTKHHLSHHLRAGLRLEKSISRPMSLSIEACANNLCDHFNGKSSYKDEKGFTLMLGVNYRFGHKYKTISKPAPVIPENKMTRYQMMTNRLNEQLDLWVKRMPDESLEAYQLRVNDHTRTDMARHLEYDISTQMATTLLPNTQITLGDYSPKLKKLAVHATSMPDFYLDMDEQEAASLFGNDVQLRNPKYTIHPDDSFELVYAEVYNPATGKTYTFDNQEKMPLNSLRYDGDYIPLSVVKETQMKETRLVAIKDQMVNLAKNDKIITDHTHISINTNTESLQDPKGRNSINYSVAIAYEVEKEFSARDDFKPGHYVTTESKAAVLMLQIMKKSFEQDFHEFVKEGKQLIIKIKGSADASPINHPIAYNGQYGEHHDQSIIANGQPRKISLTQEEGIATNEQLAFVRALGVKEWIEQNIPDIKKMKSTYEYHTEVSAEKGSKYRRISVEYTFVDAF